MDQGVAALIAGAAGMVGALGGSIAGGLAAIRGAKIGAMSSAEATRRQVQDQSMAEHSHWLRSKRADAYSEFLNQARRTEQAVDRFAFKLHAGSASFEDLTDVDEEIDKLLDCGSTIELVGPEVMIYTKHHLIQKALRIAREVRISFRDESLDIDELGIYQENLSDCREDFTIQARQMFTSTQQL
ncbi:hypothetical protein [Streptomyces sp. AA1529]|uniref:hypothetical protein n=1 Tax=Streptomyces sp. AA1529 TaxID=1203257 RepID=UPI003D75847A